MKWKRFRWTNFDFWIITTVIFCCLDGGYSQKKNKDEVRVYMEQFGFAGDSVPEPDVAAIARTDPEFSLELAITLFQAYFGLDQTGVYDSSTAKLVEAPRCGLQDLRQLSDFDKAVSKLEKKKIKQDARLERIANKALARLAKEEEKQAKKDAKAEARAISKANRGKRYSHSQLGKWTKTDLTYRILSLTFDLSPSEVEQEVRRAFDLWSAVTPLTFTQLHVKPLVGDADIRIMFAKRSHGDGVSFDGLSGVLAHAWYPNIGYQQGTSGIYFDGDAHFDDDELWTIGVVQGINLFQVAVHEFGHALGMGHSDIIDAVMTPFYTGYSATYSLHADDIAGIRALYGSGGTTTTTPTTTTTTPTTTTTTPTTTTTTPTTTTTTPTTTTTTPTTTTTTPTTTTTTPTTTTTTPTTTTTTPFQYTDFCVYSELDAFTSHVDAGVLYHYAFSGDYFVQIDTAGNSIGLPRPIADEWTSLPSNISSAIYLPAVNSDPAYTVFYKASRYYVYSEDKTFVGDFMYTVGEVLTYPRNVAVWQLACGDTL